MQYVEAPFEYQADEPSVFLAGGVGDIESWQVKVASMLCGTRWVVLNPRWLSYPHGDHEVDRQQIAWEERHMNKASLIAFWFPGKSVCPITFFELGLVLNTNKPIVVGAHPSYPRRFDLEEHVRLRRPAIDVVDSIDALVAGVIEAYPEELVEGACSGSQEYEAVTVDV